MIRAYRFDLLGHDLGRGIGEREHDRVPGHALHVTRCDGAGPAHADEQVRPAQRLADGALDVAWIRVFGQPALAGVELRQPLLADGAVTVAHDDLSRAGHQEDLGARDTGRTGAGNHDVQVIELLPDDLERRSTSPPARRRPCHAGRRARPGCRGRA